jgi:hypothetical protein
MSDMFKVVVSSPEKSFGSPIYNIIGKISMENMLDLRSSVGIAEANKFISAELFDAIESRGDMDLENIDVEEQWTEYKKLLNNPLIDRKLFEVFEKMGLVTTETDMGGNYVRLTEKGRETD